MHHVLHKGDAEKNSLPLGGRRAACAGPGADAEDSQSSASAAALGSRSGGEWLGSSYGPRRRIHRVAPCGPQVKGRKIYFAAWRQPGGVCRAACRCRGLPVLCIGAGSRRPERRKMARTPVWPEAADSQSCTMCSTNGTQKKIAATLVTIAVGHDARSGQAALEVWGGSGGD